MICPKCGSEMNDGSAFCTKCGAALNAQNNEQAKEIQTHRQIHR